ncbi:DUF177 domain-containing protein [Roseobacter fucihabitans]|nr:DUF177 domain-containing protein [Roseobacter litoralis]
MSKQIPPAPHALRVAELKQNSATGFTIRPDTKALHALGDDLGLLALRKLSFNGEVMAQGASDWVLSGKLGATVVQPCGVTLEPVTTRIDVPVRRTYLNDLDDAQDVEIEMPDDDSVESLGAWIDPEAVMIEALVLALPLYPRSEGAALGESVHAEPGVTPMRDEDARPFAGLAALRNKMSDPEEDAS